MCKVELGLMCFRSAQIAFTEECNYLGKGTTQLVPFQ